MHDFQNERRSIEIYPRAGGRVYVNGHPEHDPLPDDPDDIAPSDRACEELHRIAGVHSSTLRDAEKDVAQDRLRDARAQRREDAATGAGRAKQFVLRHQAIRVLHQIAQHIESLGRKGCTLLTMPQAVVHGVKPERPKCFHP